MAFAQAPHDWRSGRSVSSALCNCASMEYSLGRLDSAWKLQRRRIEFSQTIAQDNPSVPSLQIDVVGRLAQSSFMFGLSEQGLNDEAVGDDSTGPRNGSNGSPAAVPRGCSIWPCAQGHVLDMVHRQRPLQDNRGERDGQVRRGRPRHDRPAQAVAAGFSDLDRLEKEPQLLHLQSRPDFKALVSTLRSTTSQECVEPMRSKVERIHRLRDRAMQGSAGPVSSAKSQENQAAARHAIGMALVQLGKLDAAADYLGQALELRQQLVAEEPCRIPSISSICPRPWWPGRARPESRPVGASQGVVGQSFADADQGRRASARRPHPPVAARPIPCRARPGRRGGRRPPQGPAALVSPRKADFLLGSARPVGRPTRISVRDPASSLRIARLRPDEAIVWIMQANALAQRGNWSAVAAAFRRLLLSSRRTAPTGMSQR